MQNLQDWILLTENEHPATRSSRARAVVGCLDRPPCTIEERLAKPHIFSSLQHMRLGIRCNNLETQTEQLANRYSKHTELGPREACVDRQAL